MNAIVDPFREGQNDVAPTPTRAPIRDPWASASSSTVSTSTTRPRPAIVDPWAQPAANEAAPQIRKPTPERSWGEAAVDRVMGIGAAGLDALASTVRVSNQRTPLDRFPGGTTAFAAGEAVTGLAKLASPILPDAVNRKVDEGRTALAAARAADPKNLTPRSEFAAGFADTAAEYARDARGVQSDKEKATQARLAGVAEEGFLPALKELATNPSALATATDSLPSMLAAGGGAGGVARTLATRAGVGAAAAGRIATGTQLGTMAALEGAGAGQGAYDAVMDAKQEVLDDDPAYLRLLEHTGDPARAREALAQMARSASTGTGTAASLALMGLGERLGLNVVEDAMLGKALRGAGSSRIGNAVGAGAREFVGEAAEGAANQLAQNVGAMTGGVEDDPLRGVGGAAAMEGAVGALAGGVRGAATTPAEAGQQQAQRQPEPEQMELLALPPPGSDPIVVAPDGTAYTAQQREALGLTPDVLAAQRQRAAGNTAPFPDATPGTMADAANAIPQAAPTLPDGSPVPDPAGGPLSRVVNQGVANGGIPAGPRTWEQMQANIALDAAEAQQRVQRDREMERLARDSRLPVALFDAERDAAMREASGQNAVESEPSAMQLAMQRAQQGVSTGARPPIRDPWAGTDLDSAANVERSAHAREDGFMGIPIDPATERYSPVRENGSVANPTNLPTEHSSHAGSTQIIGNPGIQSGPLAAPITPPWSNPATGETSTPTPDLIRAAVEQQVAAQYQHNGKTALNSSMLSKAWGVPQKDIARTARQVRASFSPVSGEANAALASTPADTAPQIVENQTENAQLLAEAETASGNTALMSRAGAQGTPRQFGPGLPVDNVQRIVSDFQRRYRGNIPLQVRVGATVNDLYGLGADQLESLRSFKGAYHPRRGIVALAADRLSSRAEVESTLRHEVLGHYGLNTLAPADKQAILEAILSSRNEPSLAQMWAQTDALYADMPDLVRAEEVFAELAGQERGTLGQWWDRVLELLAKALRRAGLMRGEVSRAELQNLARRIGEGIRNGERTQQTFPANDQVQFSRADPVGSPAFGRWFGNSKVTDANGTPRAVYHGTASGFWAFDAARLGENTGHLTAPLGFFFTENRAEAQRYAEKASEGVPADERLIDVYLSIQNPKVMTLEQFHAIDSFDQARAVREQLQRQGHDGIRLTSNGRSQWIAFEPTQAKSASQNRGSFDPADPDMRFSRATTPQADPFAEENRRLREQDKSIWQKAKQVFRREFAPGGLLPEQVFGEKITRDSNFQAVEFDIRHLAGALEKAARQDFGKTLDRLPEAQQRQLGEALAGKVPDALAPETRAALVAMRQYIDALSGEYLGIIQNRIDTLAERATSTGRDADAARALDEVGLYEKIKANIGQYVHRSYRAFDDPQWFKKVPTEVLNAARRYLGEGYIEQGSPPAEARRLADVAINEILKNGTAYDSMEAFVAEGKLGAKDLSVLMRRKDVPPEIRALLGEYTDPRVNFAKSATKMGRLIWNQRFLDRVRELGVGSFLFEGRDRPASATAQLAAENSDTLAPLNGLWTFPEVAQAFKDTLGKEQMGNLYRAIVRANGMVKYGKTVLSPTTAMRNWQSAMFFSLANGHFDLREAKKGWIAFREQVAQNAKGDQLAYLRRLKELGVVYDAPYAGEMARYIQDARLEELLEGKSGKGLHLLRRLNQTAQGFYSFGDDFWKIIGFENEKAALVKAGIPAGQAETMAAERIRNTYPTYSMVGRGLKWLSRFPLAGTFVSFPAEIVRTTANMLQLTAADLKNENPGIRAIGRKRAAGMALVSAGFHALAVMTRAMFGVGDDEEEALRDLAPPWQKNSTFLYTGRDAKGQLRYFDMSFLDPYGYWKRPITAMMRDQPWEDAATSAAGDMLSPFLGTDISAGAIFEVMANKKGSGGRVYSPTGDALDQTTDIANHLRKALQPGFVGNAERLVLAAKGARREGSGQPYGMRDEVVSLLGWRASTLDTRTALYYRSFEFTDALTSARQELTRTLRSSNPVSRQDIQRSRAEAERQYSDAFRQMHRLVASARAAGMTRPQIARTLRLSGISAENTQALIAGRTPPMRIGTQSARNAVQQAHTMQGPAQAREVAQRFREAGRGDDGVPKVSSANR